MSAIFTVETGQARFAGERAGEGHPLVFLHAGVADRRMWRPQIAALQRDHPTVAYDRRGFGETTAADEAFAHVEGLREILDRLGLATVSLIGCSQGGRIAIDFTLSHPQRVAALILLAPAVSGAPAPETYPKVVQSRIEALAAAENADDIDRINAIEALLWLDGPASAEGRITGAVRELFLDMNGKALRMPELTRESDPPSALERLADLTPPTLVMNGDLDFPHIRDRCRYLIDTIPQAEGEEIPGTAHLLNLEQPETVNDRLRDFLNRWASTHC